MWPNKPISRHPLHIELAASLSNEFAKLLYKNVEVRGIRLPLVLIGSTCVVALDLSTIHGFDLLPRAGIGEVQYSGGA